MSEDPIQALKDGKEEAVEAWNEAYDSYKDALNDMSESISNGEMNVSGKYNVSLTGKEGSRSADQSVEFNLEDTANSESMVMTLNQKMTEISEVAADAPDADDVMTFEEFSELLSAFMDFNDLLDDSEYYDDYYDGYEDYEEYTLSDEDIAAITSSLKDNQAYLYNSYYEDMKPYTLTFDADLYELDTNIGDYSLDLWIKNTDSYASIAYDQGNLADDMEVYYLEEGQKLSAMSTDIGEISYYTADEVDEWDCYTTTFGIQLDEKSYLVGILELEKAANLDTETCLKSLLKELKPYEGGSSDII